MPHATYETNNDIFPKIVRSVNEKPKSEKNATQSEKLRGFPPCFGPSRKYSFDLNNKGQATRPPTAQSLSKLHDIPTSQATAFYALHTPEIQKYSV